MSIKTKLLMCVCSLGLVVVMMATSVAVVFSALSAKSDSSFSVFYTAKNIKGAVAASYECSQYGNYEYPMTIDGKSSLFEFDGTEQNAGGGFLTL